MKVLTVGHKYVAQNFEDKEGGQTIQFIEKEKQGDSFVTVNDGTTNEELIEILIDRLQVMASKFPSRETSIAITKLDEALLWLNKRTSDRIKRGVEGKPLL